MDIVNVDRLKVIEKHEKQQVVDLCSQIGSERFIQLVNLCCKDRIISSEFVDCGCENGCQWCGGAKEITSLVKQIKTDMLNV